MAHEYQMHFARPDGELGLTLFFAAENDGAAAVHATSELEAHSSFAAVEVRRDDRLVARRRRPARTADAA